MVKDILITIGILMIALLLSSIIGEYLVGKKWSNIFEDDNKW